MSDKRLLALGQANDRRTGKAVIRRELRELGRRDGPAKLADILEELPVSLERLYAFQVLQLAPGVGDTKAAAMLKVAGVVPWARAGKLTGRQVRALQDALTRLSAFPYTRPSRAVPRPEPCPEPVPVRKPQKLRGPRCSVCGEGPLLVKGLCGWCENERKAA